MSNLSYLLVLIDKIPKLPQYDVNLDYYISDVDFGDSEEHGGFNGYEKLKISTEKLKEKIATHKVPSIDEYINLKIQLDNEQKKTKVFERKIYIKKLIERNQTIKKIRPPAPRVESQQIVL